MSPYYMNQYMPCGASPYNAMQARQEIVKVNGQNGASAYQLPPNSSVLLLDEQQPLVWLKQTDGAGYATLIPYTISPYQQEQTIDVKQLEQRIVRLENVINAKSDITSNERSESE